MSDPALPQWTRVSAYGLVIHEGKIVLCRISPDIDARQRWTLPGGGIDFGEDPVDAMVREVMEETGLIVAPGALAGVDALRLEANGRDVHAIRIVYFAHLIGASDLTFELDGSTDMCAWWTASEARELGLVTLAQLGLDHAFGG